nr:MAG TPA: hypothetical protein [Caudoviricetes sp.]
MKKIVLAVLSAAVLGFGANDDSAKSLTMEYLKVMQKPYKEFMDKCLGGKMPDMQAMNDAKCSLYDEGRDYSYYKKLSGKIKFGENKIEDMQSLDGNYGDAMSTLADRVANLKAANPTKAKNIDANLEFVNKVVDIKEEDGETKVYYSLSNLQELIKMYNLGIYTEEILYDGILSLECDSKCKIVP